MTTNRWRHHVISIKTNICFTEATADSRCFGSQSGSCCNNSLLPQKPPVVLLCAFRFLVVTVKILWTRFPVVGVSLVVNKSPGE